MREHLVDGAKASPLVGYVVTSINGVDWGQMGAFVMFIYAILLVLDKLGLLTPLKQVAVRVVHRPPPPTSVSHRTRQDE